MPNFFGTSGADTLTGSNDDDYIEGAGGGDSIRAGNGADLVDAGSGNDSVWGEGGSDEIFGQGGNDYIDGGDGADFIFADTGDDEVFGGGGDDELYAGDGDDLINGGSGADSIFGGNGFDTFVASDGDTINDFNTGDGQDFNNGNITEGTGQNDNDFVDLSSYYTAENLEAINDVRDLAGQDTYANRLAWLRADQADGVLDDLNKIGLNFTLTLKNGGSAVAAGNLTWDNTAVPCFGSDTLIRCKDREQIRAGDLQVGDLVETRDSGLLPIRWIGKRMLGPADLAANPKLRPIRIRRAALGLGLPEADLLVSPQHRILVRSKIAMRIFGASEVLVAAKQLCQIDGIEIAEDIDRITYVHFLFDNHQIVLSNGAETESLYTGPEALKSVGPAAMREIYSIFPELREGPATVPARFLVPGRIGRKFAERHAQNRKPLLC
ncbi:Hint domain-containing protein [Paracoccus aerodenitrificans]|uniref:Hint domain-containing protein n=1 Tax=Paracoccus aerodenitrificans TaxID=3017781 RepID=UPI0022F0AEF8|nr:Hint domain-containing protein [Paracoccus aerodenitrificans]WBU65472.1 Hint domain-containing protein [Paracoccus aerodenitrificans]